MFVAKDSVEAEWDFRAYISLWESRQPPPPPLPNYECLWKSNLFVEAQVHTDANFAAFICFPKCCRPVSVFFHAQCKVAEAFE